MPKDIDAEFFGIASDLVEREARDYLDKRLEAVERWVEQRESLGEPADLRAMIDQVMHEPNARPPVIVALCAALWELRERRANDRQ